MRCSQKLSRARSCLPEASIGIRSRRAVGVAEAKESYNMRPRRMGLGRASREKVLRERAHGPTESGREAVKMTKEVDVCGETQGRSKEARADAAEGRGEARPEAL